MSLRLCQVVRGGVNCLRKNSLRLNRKSVLKNDCFSEENAFMNASMGKRYSSDVRSQNLSVQLEARIKAMGPLTIADYMTEVLTNPTAGYYQHKTIFGESGDFITSPEISQMFGELIASWFLTEWQKIGSPKPLQIIELGPGRGTLMSDIIRVLTYFGEHDISVHLVELSEQLSIEQAKTLRVTLQDEKLAEQPLYYRMGHTESHVPVYWYTDIRDVPKSFSFVVANEFFDALPIHKFEKTDTGWREILIDIDPDADERAFRYIQSRASTPAAVFIKIGEKRRHVEISPKTGAIIENISSRVEQDGGIVLLADYGDDGCTTDTFRAFRNHILHNPLVEPGTADLTADVDFSYIRSVAEPKLATYGPVTQGEFLQRIGISLRLNMLLEKCTPKEAETLRSSYDMLVDKDKMGERFKFFVMFPAVLKDFHKKFPVAGFV